MATYDGPVPPGHLSRLIRATLPLAPALAQVVARIDGSVFGPAFNPNVTTVPAACAFGETLARHLPPFPPSLPPQPAHKLHSIRRRLTFCPPLPSAAQVDAEFDPLASTVTCFAPKRKSPAAVQLRVSLNGQLFSSDSVLFRYGGFAGDAVTPAALVARGWRRDPVYDYLPFSPDNCVYIEARRRRPAAARLCCASPPPSLARSQPAEPRPARTPR